MSDIIVREASLKDAESIYKLNCEEMGYEFDLEKTRNRLNYLISHNEHKIFVAEHDSEVVGYVHANNYDLIYGEPLKNIMGIAVFKNFKRNGIGHKLLNAIEKWAKDTGAVGIRLVSGASRLGAHEFYKACGYENKKEQKNFIKIF